MPGPFDIFDPSQMAAVQGTNGPVQVPAVVASRFQPPIQIPAPDAPPSPAPLPLSIGGIPQLPPAIAAKLAPAPAAPPVPAVAPAGNAPAPTAAPRGKPAPAAQLDPFAEAQQITERGLMTRQQAALDIGDANARSADQQADAIAEGNRQADIARAAQKKQLERDQAEQTRLRADLETAQKQYADHKVDAGRFWHDSSTGQKVMMGIGLALSAAGSVLKHEGSKNPALDMIMGAIQRDVQLQMADREKLGAVVGQKSSALDRMITLTRDHQSAMEAAIAGSLERVKGQVAEIAARTQSATARANAADLVGQLDVQIGAARDAAAQGAENRRRQDQQLEIQRKQVAIAGGHLALEKKRFDEGKRQFDLGRADMYYREAMDALQKGNENVTKLAAKGAINATDAKALQEMDLKQREQVVFAPPTVIKDPKTGEIRQQVEQIRNADGSVLQIPKEEAAKVRDKMASAIMYSQAVDRLIDWRKEHGWESKSWNSADLQTAKSLLSDLIIAKKNAAALGALSESDLKLVTDAIGTDDPGSIRDPSAALLEGRRSVWASVNSDLIAHGYDGARVDMPTPGTADAQDSEVQALTRDAQDRYKPMDARAAAESSRAIGDTGFDTPYGSPRMTTNSLIAIQKLVQQARDPRSPNNGDALVALRTLADDPDPGVQRLVRDQIDSYRLPVANPSWRPGAKPKASDPISSALRGGR